MIGDMRKLLKIPHIRIHNANALSSPFTIGFPAMSGWLGTMHALERKLKADGFSSLIFKAIAVVSHASDLQTHKGVGDYGYSLVGTANPLEKDGKRAAFIEEARIHLDVSLVIEYDGVSDEDDKDLLKKRVAHHLLGGMKMAGGDILGFGRSNGDSECELKPIEEGDDKALARFTRTLMPGYLIIERRELMREAMERGADAIEALLEYLAVHHRYESDEERWISRRKVSGWIVPIAIGFQGISPLGKAKNQRDPNTPHRFAESVVTLGEFKMVYKVATLDEMLWHYHVDQPKGLYLCQQITVPSVAN